MRFNLCQSKVTAYLSLDINESWDGTYQNKRCQDGVYFWTSNWKGVLNGISQVQSSKGVVHLMR